MRSSSFIALVFLTFAFLFLPAANAARAEVTSISSAICGTTPREAIAAAEKALADKQRESQARALACLLAAVKALEGERLDIVVGEEKQRFLNVPRGP